MPRPTLVYPVNLDPLPSFYALSPWSLAEIARRFGLGRSNLMGLLRGEHTVSHDKLMALLSWSGLEVKDRQLRLAPVLQVWRIASIKHLEALQALPDGLQPGTDWVLVSEADVPRREWIHVWSVEKGKDGENKAQVLLSVRPDFYPLLCQHWPHLGGPSALRYFAPGKSYADLASTLGKTHLYLTAEASTSLWVTPQEPQPGDRADFQAWAQWLRQSLHMDTSPWLLGEAQENSSTEDETAALNWQTPAHHKTCELVQTALTHRLDVGSTHAAICDVPVFSLTDKRQYPSGMVRLDQSFLGDQGLQWGKAQKLRWYIDPATGDKWLVKMKSHPHCGLPEAFTADTAGQWVLMLREELLQIGRTETKGEEILGEVLASVRSVTSQGHMALKTAITTPSVGKSPKTD
ncbi:hypothetical protein [Acidithiobacillus thiooxidans]|uniref:Uncharacterized protein n=1 Tax=Acidithiobacillus thiooxidans ATCC 19377 TaxID=637390 RepID=A0A543Q028_ACITH|nr:hypothetical protein [Acidithiobacillus thiooxidans]MDX5936321.1 hypothetical protein [Acidithiobacillus thiooxidans]TQN49683.1 hypothetical protein DLNHIDIE_03093 [Acidithiobacillus thiooxidans ATCC 19377]